MKPQAVADELNKVWQKIQPKPTVITMVKAADGSYSSGFNKEDGGTTYLRKQHPA